MPDYVGHVLVCATAHEDGNHCGSKGGPEIRQIFNRALVDHGLLQKVTVSGVGCTSQHGLCDQSQCTVIVYGPKQELGGTWYVASPDNVDEIITEHLINGRVVDKLVNKERNVDFE